MRRIILETLQLLWLLLQPEMQFASMCKYKPVEPPVNLFSLSDGWWNKASSIFFLCFLNFKLAVAKGVSHCLTVSRPAAVRVCWTRILVNAVSHKSAKTSIHVRQTPKYDCVLLQYSWGGTEPDV